MLTMNSLYPALWGLLFFILPAGILAATARLTLLKKAGPIVVTYALGLLIGNSGLLPAGFAGVQDILTTITVPLSLPLIFFSLNIRSIGKIAGSGVRSLFGGLLAVIIASFAAFFIYGRYLGGEAWKAAGMLVGVYTGGTPNLASIGTALRVDSLFYVAIHGSDVVISALILLGIITVFPPLLRKLLGPFPLPPAAEPDAREEEEQQSYDANFKPVKREDIGDILRALGLAVLIFAAGGSFMLFLPEAAALPAVILAITSLGVGASFIPRIRALKKSFQTGFYLILVFSLTVSSMADIQSLTATAPAAIIYVAILLGLVTVLHVLFSFILRVDAETHLITATAFIFSPPFVPMVAASLGNRRLVLPGILIGIIGWVSGNYLGLAVAGILSGF
jgi:uncharacterized membrane protein